MSYYFEMSFKEIKKEDILDYCISLSEYYKKHAENIIEENKYYIPSIRRNFLETDKYIYASSPWQTADRYWLHKLFDVIYIYWPEKEILGIVGSIPKEFDNLTTIAFQNSCDQDYDFETWKGISYFEDIVEKYKDAAIEILRAHFDDSDIKDTNLEYYRKWLVYEKIYQEMELDNWIWNKGGNFKTFTMNAFNYSEEEVGPHYMLEKIRKKC